MKLKTCSKHSLRVRVAAAVVGFLDDDDVTGRYACAVHVTSREEEKKANKTMKEKDRVHIGVIMRISDFICLSFGRSFVRLFVRLFVCLSMATSTFLCGLFNGFSTYV